MQPDPELHGDPPDLTVIIVSFNTVALTLRAIDTLYGQTFKTRFNCIVFDNASDDGSADAIAARFPQVRLIRSAQNIGFARANNLAAMQCRTPYLLLLNPDTETQAGAIDALMHCARNHPRAGIWGGRTVFADGSLNMASCWAAPSLRGLLCRAVGLSTLLPRSSFANPERYGAWPRDTLRDVDIVVGCFLLIERGLWQELRGFDPKYFMYGEDADLCLRARAKGRQPMITPEAQIVHHVGASTPHNDEKAIAVMRARASLVRDHWSAPKVPFGIALMWLWSALRFAVTRPLRFFPRFAPSARRWETLWRGRQIWLRGYGQI